MQAKSEAGNENVKLFMRGGVTSPSGTGGKAADELKAFGPEGNLDVGKYWNEQDIMVTPTSYLCNFWDIMPGLLRRLRTDSRGLLGTGKGDG